LKIVTVAVLVIATVFVNDVGNVIVTVAPVGRVMTPGSWTQNAENMEVAATTSSLMVIDNASRWQFDTYVASVGAAIA
jgi:hypothetical protein